MARNLALTAHRVLNVELTSSAPVRNSIGGAPILPEHNAMPTCSCGKRMLLFFQFDIQSNFGLPFITGSHFSIFMCPIHNDAPIQLESPLAHQYWKHRDSYGGVPNFYYAALEPPGQRERLEKDESVLANRELIFSPVKEVFISGKKPASTSGYSGVSSSPLDASALQEFKVGGQPSWLDTPSEPVCSCGTPMTFLAQIPGDYPFRKASDSPPQPNSWSDDDYLLFLGNSTYIFACPKSCTPQSVYPILQH